MPPVSKLLNFFSNKNVILTILIFIFILIMLVGTLFAYIIIKSREEFMTDFEKWCQIVEWEEIKAGGLLGLTVNNENRIRTDEESDNSDVI